MSPAPHYDFQGLYVSTHKAKIIAIANQKGGVGKTTTAVNTAASLVALGKRVLLIDMDPQGNATMGSGVDKNRCAQTVADLLLAEATLAEVRVSSDSGGYDLLPANGDLVAADVQLIQRTDREQQLKRGLAEVAGDYHYMLIDCPPSLNLLTVNALVAADSVLITMQCEYFALEGLTDLSRTISQIGRELNPTLTIEGILRTMYDQRAGLTGAVSEQLYKYFGDKVYRTAIPRNVRLAEAPSHGLPCLAYDKNSKGALAYLALAQELLRRHSATGAAQ